MPTSVAKKRLPCDCAGYARRSARGPGSIRPGRAAAASPACQRFDTRQQFGKRIRLWQVVVTAGPQAFDAVVDLAERGQDQHRRLDALGTQFADDRETIALGQHAVDDQHVVLPVGGQCQALLAIRRLVGDVADLAERAGDIVGRVAVVLDDQ